MKIARCIGIIVGLFLSFVPCLILGIFAHKRLGKALVKMGENLLK